MKDKKKILQFLKESLVVFLGSILLAFAISFCFVNYQGSYIYGFDSTTHETLQIQFNGILSGGTSGFSLILRGLFFKNATNGSLVVENIITITTIVLFIVGALFLGKKFAIHTLISTIVTPIFIYIFKLPIFATLHNQFNLFDPVVCAVIGGLLMGVGCGIAYKVGGSTGGFDVPGMIVNKYSKIKLSLIFLIQDGLLVIFALIANFKLYEIVVGLISVIAYSFAVDVTQRVGNEAYVCDIISEHWEVINKEILDLGRGTTIVDVIGGFTLKPRKMIKTMISKNQYLDILNIVKRIDPNAFMSMTKTSDVFGEGYTDITNFSNK